MNDDSPTQITPDDEPDTQAPDVTDEALEQTPDDPVETPETQTQDTETSSDEENLESEETDEDDFDPLAQFGPQERTDLPPLDYSQLPTDEYGNVDAQALVAALNNQVAAATQAAREEARAELMEQRQEERLWTKAFEKYPELKKDASLRDVVQSIRIGEAAQKGEYVSPLDAAKKLMKDRSDARASGIKEMTEQVKIQNAAHVETSSAKVDQSGSKAQDLYSKIASRNPAEADQAQKELLKSIFFGSE